MAALVSEGRLSDRVALSLGDRLSRAEQAAAEGSEERTIGYLSHFIARAKNQIKGDEDDVTVRDLLVEHAETLTQHYQELEDAENAQAASPDAMLERDRANGTLTPEQYARHAIYRWFEPTNVPSQYRPQQPAETADLTVPLAAAFQNFFELDPVVQAEIQDYLTPGDPRALPQEPLTEEEFDAAVALVRDMDQDDDEASSQESNRISQRSAQSLAPSKLGTLLCDDDLLDWFLPYGIPLACRYVTPLAEFHYVPQNVNSKHGLDQNADLVDAKYRLAPAGGPNGIPDELDAIALAYYQAATTYKDLNFGAPPLGSPLPPIKVVIGDLDGGGMSLPVIDTFAIDKNSSVYLTRHELFHQYQYRYFKARDLAVFAAEYFGNSYSSTPWWLEATAEWAAHKAEDAATGRARSAQPFTKARHAYAKKLDDHLGNPSAALTRYAPPSGIYKPQYGSFIFAEYLEQRFGAGIVEETWQATVDRRPFFFNHRAIDAIAETVTKRGATLSEVVADYHRANYTITNSYRETHRHNWVSELSGFDERPDRDRVRVHVGGATSSGTVTVNAGGAFYLDIEQGQGPPQGMVATVTLDAAQSGPATEHFAAQMVRFDKGGHPKQCPQQSGNSTILQGTASKKSTQVALTAACPTTTVIVSHTGAQEWGSLTGGNRSRLTVTYSITVRPASILVAGVGDTSSGLDAGDIGGLVSGLESAGFQVVRATGLPRDLTPYAQVWWMGEWVSGPGEVPLDKANRDLLVSYVKQGGSLFLTGEWGCCPLMNAGVTDIINSVVPTTDTVLTVGGDTPAVVAPVYAGAPGALATYPHLLDSWTGNGVGHLLNVPRRNRFVTSEPNGDGLVFAAAWDNHEVTGGGRLVVMMDMNWHGGMIRGENWTKVAENIGAFLAGSGG
jgi:hypothetical protein